ncbi:MAG TPA: RNA polymerase sigma factor [Solirubrobacteraceae bacterium]
MQPRLLRSPARLAGASLLRVQTDDRLVALARDGHERAFEAIVERYRPALERYAARLVGPSRGEDAVQQAFVNAHAALIANPDKTIELRPWLYRIVHNAALNTLRSARDEQPLGDAAELLPLDDDVIERRERLREALDALAALPANQRDAILLRELEGRSHDEIAVALGLTPGAARQQIFRARAALRAAATALTPQPLLVKTLELAAAGGGGSGAAEVAAGAGAGLTAVLTKAGAGVLVTGAVVGGAVGTGVVHTPTPHHQRPPAAREAAAHPKAGAASTSHGAAAPADRREHGAGASERRSTSHGERSGDRRRGGAHSGGADRGRRDSATPVTRPVNRHSGSGRTGSAVQEVHHSGGGGSAGETGHTGHRGGGHSGHGGRGGETVAGATTQPEASEVETEATEVEAETGGGGVNSGGGGGGGSGGGGGGATTTDAQPPATTTDGTVTTAPTGGGGGGGAATTLLPPDSGKGEELRRHRAAARARRRGTSSKGRPPERPERCTARPAA